MICLTFLNCFRHGFKGRDIRFPYAQIKERDDLKRMRDEKAEENQKKKSKMLEAKEEKNL